MKWFLIFKPFASLKLLLVAICVFTIGYLLAINVLIIEVGDANGSKREIASDPEHVYCTSPKKTDTEIWLTVKVCGLIRTLHFVQGRNPA
jgi:hypothetical protein